MLMTIRTFSSNFFSWLTSSGWIPSSYDVSWQTNLYIILLLSMCRMLLFLSFLMWIHLVIMRHHVAISSLTFQMMINWKLREEVIMMMNSLIANGWHDSMISRVAAATATGVWPFISICLLLSIHPHHHHHDEDWLMCVRERNQLRRRIGWRTTDEKWYSGDRHPDVQWSFATTHRHPPSDSW